MKDKKIVIQFVHALTSGGAETMVADYSVELKKRGYDVRVVVIRSMPDMINQKKLEEAGVPIISTLPDPKNIIDRGIQHFTQELRTYYFMKKYIKKVHPDVVHVHLKIARFLLGAKKELINSKIVYTCHSDPKKNFLGASHETRKDTKALKNLIQNNNVTIIALHKKMVEDINQIFHIRNTIALNNPVNLKKFQNVRINRYEYRKQLGITEDAFIVGHIGRFTEAKNHKMLVNIFSEVLKKEPKAFLLMIGNGELLSTIRQQMEEKKMQGHYMILSEREDIPELLKIMDVFCFPSLWEGMPLVVLEAQAAGLKCVISDCITPEVMVTSQICSLPLESSAKDWADKLFENAGQKKTKNNLEAFDINTVMDRLEKIYEE